MAAKAHQDLDIKYRPSKLEDVIGQANAVAVIRGFKGRIPRTLGFFGPSGAGKTTLARILAMEMGVANLDYQEINCGVVTSAIEMVRDLNQSMTIAPMASDKRIWTLDEVQTLSRQKNAQETLLKVLEECPPHVHFFLCTTDPKRLLTAVRTRLVKIDVVPVTKKDLKELVERIAKAEGIKLAPEVSDRIAENANGSAREAVKILQKAAGIEDPELQLALVSAAAEEAIAFELVKALLPWKGSPQWPDVAKVLADIKEEDPEGIRQMVLASARSSLLKGGANAGLAYKAIRALSEPLYDRSSGHAILAAACYLVCYGTPK